MNATLLYRIASVSLILCAAGHTIGFRMFKPPIAEGLVASLVLSRIYLAPVTAVFSALVALCLGRAAWLVR